MYGWGALLHVSLVNSLLELLPAAGGEHSTHFGGYPGGAAICSVPRSLEGANHSDARKCLFPCTHLTPFVHALFFHISTLLSLTRLTHSLHPNRSVAAIGVP